MQNIINKTVTQSSDQGVTTVAKASTSDTATQTVASVLYFILGIMEVALAFRLVLKVTGANPSSGFVSSVYSFTQLLIVPFRGIFPVATNAGVVTTAAFEPATIVAMLVYAVLAWGAVKLIAIMAGQSQEEL